MNSCYEKQIPKFKNIYEKNSCILIPSNKNNTLLQTEYSLKQGMFDPFQSSPPNEFMAKLKSRMSIYDSFVTNDVSRKSE
jgi:hypothetical protein